MIFNTQIIKKNTLITSDTV